MVRFFAPRVSKAGIEHVDDRKGHAVRYSLDDAKLRATGRAPRVGLADG